MADSTAVSLASEEEKKYLEQLKEQKALDNAFLAQYQGGSANIYNTTRQNAGGFLDTSKGAIENLYNQGYTDLQNLTGQESEAAIKESLRPIENKLQTQGLMGGPSGALNEALAGASERVRNAALSKLEDYVNTKTGALANVYSNTASQQSALEQAYGTQSQGLLATALQQKIADEKAKSDASNAYTMTGLEGALGTNKIAVETAAAKDIATNQANLNANAVSTATDTRAKELKTRQDAYDKQVSSWMNSQPASWAGYTMAQKQAQALSIFGQRPS